MFKLIPKDLFAVCFTVADSCDIYNYNQGHLYVPVRPRPANKLCPLNFSISTCINFHLKNQKKKFTTCQHHKR